MTVRGRRAGCTSRRCPGSRKVSAHSAGPVQQFRWRLWWLPQHWYMFRDWKHGTRAALSGVFPASDTYRGILFFLHEYREGWNAFFFFFSFFFFFFPFFFFFFLFLKKQNSAENKKPTSGQASYLLGKGSLWLFPKRPSGSPATVEPGDTFCAGLDWGCLWKLCEHKALAMVHVQLPHLCPLAVPTGPVPSSIPHGVGGFHVSLFFASRWAEEAVGAEKGQPCRTWYFLFDSEWSFCFVLFVFCFVLNWPLRRNTLVTCGFHALSLPPTLCGVTPFPVADIKSLSGRRGRGRGGQRPEGPQHPLAAAWLQVPGWTLTVSWAETADGRNRHSLPSRVQMKSLVLSPLSNDDT